MNIPHDVVTKEIDGLVEKINNISAKPLRYGVQTLMAMTFFNEVLENAHKYGTYVYEHQDQVKTAVGNVGYGIAQLGLPTGAALGAALLGYIAVKGSGAYLDQYWYSNSK